MATTLQILAFTIALATVISFDKTKAEPTQPFSNFLRIDRFINKTSYWSQFMFQSDEPMLKLASHTVLAGVLCFVAASISSAGGIGGGGLFIPILTIVAGLDLKTASAFSAFMVTGGSVANVMCSMCSPRFGGKCLIDYDIALLSEPGMLLGVSVGVICNQIFPEWLITVLFVVFLVWSTFKTCKNGVARWNSESEEANRNGYRNLENGLGQDGSRNQMEATASFTEPLLDTVTDNRMSFTWQNFWVLVLIWFSFSFIYLLRGNRYSQGIAPMKPCGVGYWILSLLQIPLAIVFTAWILLKKKNHQSQPADTQLFAKKTNQSTERRTPNKFIFPAMALLTGILGGVFGIGGGMLISPLLLHIGISPEVTAATCSFMVFFSSTMSAFQYLLSGMEHTDTALIFAFICFIASLVGLVVVQRIIKEYGRASIIVFSLSVVMALSTVLITSFGAIDAWRDYESGTNMGFKLPC